MPVQISQLDEEAGLDSNDRFSNAQVIKVLNKRKKSMKVKEEKEEAKEAAKRKRQEEIERKREEKRRAKELKQQAKLEEKRKKKEEKLRLERERKEKEREEQLRKKRERQARETVDQRTAQFRGIEFGIDIEDQLLPQFFKDQGKVSTWSFFPPFFFLSRHNHVTIDCWSAGTGIHSQRVRQD